MDKQQEEFQFLGIIAIFKESFKIILSTPKLFTKITLALILPSSLIALVNVEISNLLFKSSQVSVSPHANNHKKSIIIPLWILMILLGLMISVFSISAVIYTVACIYTRKEITFRKIMSVIPKVWKRLMITLLSNLCIVFVYIVVVSLISVICLTIISVYSYSNKSGFSNLQLEMTIFVAVVSILLFVGLTLAVIFWQLANVISVMEEYCGFKAMKKSRELIKGKIGTAICIYMVLSICYVPMAILHRKLGQSDRNFGIGPKISYGILSFVLNTLLVLYSLVVQTVFYFVCKSYHHENIDRTFLADHLESFRGGYLPLTKNGDVEIERLNV